MELEETALFFVTVEVRLDEPIASKASPSEPPLQGYFMSFGVRAKDKQGAMHLVRETIFDGKVDWQQSEWRETHTIDPNILKIANTLSDIGIWYKSGRIFFPAN